MTAPAKITLATFKSFIRKNRDALQILVSSKFDGMTDGCEGTGQTDFSPALECDRKDEGYTKHTLEIAGVWLVGGGRDYFTAYNNNGFTGIEWSNCCGHGVIAIRPAPVARPALALFVAPVVEAWFPDFSVAAYLVEV